MLSFALRQIIGMAQQRSLDATQANMSMWRNQLATIPKKESGWFKLRSDPGNACRLEISAAAVLVAVTQLPNCTKV
jgi:hypothetical protein